MRSGIFLVVLLLAGCKVTDGDGALTPFQSNEPDHRPLRMSVPFNPENAKFALKPGTSSISGRVKLVGSEDGQRPPDHGTVELWPVTPHTTDRMQTRFEGKKRSSKQVKVENADDRLNAYLRKTDIQPDGSYRFDRVAAGHYYLKAATASTTGSISKQSGAAYTDVEIAEEQNFYVNISVQSDARPRS